MKTKGFTLIEVMLALTITVGIIFTVISFGNNILTFNSSASQSLTAQLESRQALKTMVRELRGLKSLISVGPSAITFVLNDKNITYFLDTSSRRLVREVDGAQSTLVSDLISTSTPIFDYYDENYAGTSSPLTLPADLLEVGLIKITFFVDKDLNRLPTALETTSQVSLRNLKSNL